MLFRSRGNQASDPKYGAAARIISVDEMLSYRNTWKEKVTPEFDVFAMLKDARTVKQTPTATLTTSENGYRVKDAARLNENEKTVRLFQSALNKLAEKNYPDIITQVLKLEMLDEEVITDVVNRIYDKALEEPAFSQLYAQLCHDIAKFAFESERNNRPKTIDGDKVRVAIIGKAQNTFELMSHLDAQDEADIDRIRKKKLANMKFIGELFHRQLLKPKVMAMILAGIFRTGEANTPPPSPIDAEVALSLLNVVGKEVETIQNIKRVWDVIAQHMASGVLGKRLTFLYQNVMDLRAAGWIRKEEPTKEPEPPTPHSATGHGSSSGAGFSSSYERRGGGGSGGSGGASAHNVDPAPHSPPVVAAPQLSKEELKQAQLARPPEAFTSEHARKACSIMRDTLADDLWERSKQEYSAMCAGEPEHVNRMACFYGVALNICLSAKESDRKVLIAGLTNAAWDASEVCRGVAWALTEMITGRLSEDCPLCFERFADLASGPLARSRIPILTAVKDVFARTSNYLDALFVLLEGTPEWAVDFIAVWEFYVQKFFASFQSKGGSAASAASAANIPPINDILAALGSVRQTQFMKSILPDFVQTLLSTTLYTKDELDSWRAKNEGNSKMAELVSELTAMILF